MSASIERKPRGSGDRLLAALALFTIERPQWTVEEAAEALGVSATTAYRYFKQLTGTGLITPVAGAGYTLGPAIVQMDRQIQATDPMLIAARDGDGRSRSSMRWKAPPSCSAACSTTASCACTR